jgi:hypothetical protein
MRMLRDMSEIATWIAELRLKICGRRFLNYTTGKHLTRTHDPAIISSKSLGTSYSLLDQSCQSWT